MTKIAKDPAKAVFKMLGFQYKPVQKAFIKIFSQTNKGKELVKKYQKANYAVKIMMLDRFVAYSALNKEMI